MSTIEFETETLETKCRQENKMKKNTFASNLKEELIIQGKSIKHLAEFSGVSPTAIYQYKEGLNYPSDEILIKICECLDLPYKKMVDLIKKDRSDVRPRRKKTIKPQYSEFRVALLETYDQSENLLTGACSIQQMTSELSRYSYHPIERMIVDNILLDILIKSRLISSPSDISYLMSATSDIISKKINSTRFSWSFNIATSCLGASFLNKQHREILYYKLAWIRTADPNVLDLSNPKFKPAFLIDRNP